MLVLDCPLETALPILSLETPSTLLHQSASFRARCGALEPIAGEFPNRLDRRFFRRLRGCCTSLFSDVGSDHFVGFDLVADRIVFPAVELKAAFKSGGDLANILFEMFERLKFA